MSVARADERPANLVAGNDHFPTIAAVEFLELWHGYDLALHRLIERYGPTRVCEIGGGRKPALDPDDARRLEIEYVLLDISADELAAAPDWCEKIVGDIASADLAVTDRFDFMFSRMLAEHVEDGRQFHANVLRALRPGGVAFHFFPTLITIPFLANKLLPEDSARRLLHRVQPRARDKRIKFPAHYRWTWGPTARQVRRLEDVGFELLAYVGGFGHHYYVRLPPLHRGMQAVWDFARHHELYHFASYAYLVVRKPG